MKRALAAAMLLTLAALPLAAACEFVCLWRDSSASQAAGDDCHREKDSGAAPWLVLQERSHSASCSHVAVTPLLAALKRTTEAKGFAAAVEPTPDARLRHVPAALALAGAAGPLHRLAAVLQIPLRI